MTSLQDHHDVVVVGGRSAGAATAMLLARLGHDVAVVERAELPSDTLSTHGIARGGVVQLHRWGLLDEVLASGAPAIRRITFRSGEEGQTHRVKPRAGVDLLVAPRRHVLDTLLAERAAADGATVHTGVTATRLHHDATGRVCGLQVRDRAGRLRDVTARYVVGADGVRSRLAGWVGATTQQSAPRDSATAYCYLGDVAWDGFEFHVGEVAKAGVFPTHQGEACVWVCAPTAVLDPVLRAGPTRAAALLDLLAATSPSLGERLRRATVRSPVRGAARLPNHLRRPTGPGWALVGDAGYHRDPVSGHGMTDAFRDAELLAVSLDLALREPAAEAVAMSTYHSARDAAARPILDLTVAMAEYPGPARFVALQKQLSAALDAEAEHLARRPLITGRIPAAA
jgi:flavin-dependent dehydrogenase